MFTNFTNSTKTSQQKQKKYALDAEKVFLWLHIKIDVPVANVV